MNKNESSNLFYTFLDILTTSARTNTIGNPKLLIMKPIVKNIDKSMYDGPNSALCIDLLIMSVGITENTYSNMTKLGHHKLKFTKKIKMN